MAREHGSFICIMSVPMDERAFWNQPDSRMPDYDQVYQGL